MDSEITLLSEYADMTNVTVAKVDGSRWQLLRKRFYVNGFPCFFLIKVRIGFAVTDKLSCGEKGTKVYRFVGSHVASHLRSFVFNLTHAEEFPDSLFGNPSSRFWRSLSMLESMYLKSARWIRNSGIPVYGLAWISCILLIVLLMIFGCVLNVICSFRESRTRAKKD